MLANILVGFDCKVMLANMYGQYSNFRAVKLHQHVGEHVRHEVWQSRGRTQSNAFERGEHNQTLLKDPSTRLQPHNSYQVYFSNLLLNVLKQVEYCKASYMQKEKSSL